MYCTGVGYYVTHIEIICIRGYSTLDLFEIDWIRNKIFSLKARGMSDVVSRGGHVDRVAILSV